MTLIFLDICMCVYFVYNPSLPNMPGNILPSNKWYWFPLVHLFPVYFNTVILLQSAMVACLMFIYGAIYLPLVVRELDLGGSNYRALHRLRRSDKLMLVYRMVYIVQEILNSVIGKFMVPLQWAFTTEFVFGSCILIGRRKELSAEALLTVITWSVFPPACWALLLYAGGYLCCTGEKILKSWKYYKYWPTTREKQIVLKFEMSCKPLTVSHGKFFVIRKESLPLFLRALAFWLMRTLLATT